MGANSNIEWTDHTFNTWHGCVEVSEACDFCYARELDARYHGNDVHWGAHGARKFMSDKYWKQLDDWNRKAQKAGQRAFVFVASMADLFEFLPRFIAQDGRTLDTERERFFRKAEQTPWLCYLLLTKRPQNVRRMVPQAWLQQPLFDTQGRVNLSQCGWPDNVWIGATVEEQKYLWPRVSKLDHLPAPVRFLSIEPQFGPIDLTTGLSCLSCGGKGTTVLREESRGPGGYDLVTIPCAHCLGSGRGPISWVINGGESDSKGRSRPAHPNWFRGVRDACAKANVPYFFKQVGDWAWDGYEKETPSGYTEPNAPCVYIAPDGATEDATDPHSRRPAPNTVENCARWLAFCRQHKGAVPVYQIGKKAAGKLLDGVAHTGRPDAGIPHNAQERTLIR